MSRSHRVRVGLVLGGVLLVSGCSTMRNAPLEGTRWRWVSIEQANGRFENAVPGEHSYPFIDFRPDSGGAGMLVGYGGCNRVTATYRVEDRALSVAELRTTRLSCGMATDGAEGRFTHALTTARGFEIEGTQLRIQCDGSVIHFSSTEPLHPDSVTVWQSR